MSEFYEKIRHEFKSLPLAIPNGLLYKKCKNCGVVVYWDDAIQKSVGTSLKAIEESVCIGHI